MAETRVLVDLRGTQPSEPGLRGGIHRYVTELTAALAAMDDRLELHGLVRPDRVLPPIAPRLARDGRLHHLASLPELVASGPLVYHVASPFSLDLGLGELLPRSLRGTPLAVTLYDSIPLVAGLVVHDQLRHLWAARGRVVQDADLVLSISDFTAEDGIRRLGLAPEKLRTVGTGVPQNPPELPVPNLRGLEPPFVLYTGGTMDPRKNVDLLIGAFGLLPEHLRSTHQLVIASYVNADRRRQLESIAKLASVSDRVLLPGWVSDDDLHALMRHAEALIYPSKYEGFGLPIAEAMSHGTPVVASVTTSCGDLHGHPEASFDPEDGAGMSQALARVLDEPQLRERLRRWGYARVRAHRWDEVAARHAEAYDELFAGAESRGARRPGRTVVAAWGSVELGSCAHQALLAAKAVSTSVRVATSLPRLSGVEGLRTMPLGAVLREVPGSDSQVVCVPDGVASLPDVTATLRARPGVLVLWELDAILEDTDALAAAAVAAGRIVVRDIVDEWRLRAALGPAVAERLVVLKPPLGFLTPTDGALIPHLESVVYLAPGRDEVRRRRRIPVVLALRPARHGPWPDDELRGFGTLATVLASQGEAVEVRVLGLLDRDVAQTIAAKRPPRLHFGAAPSGPGLAAALTAADVVLAPGDDGGRAATEAVVDLAVAARRIVIAPGAGTDEGAGTVRLPPDAGVAGLATAVLEALERRTVELPAPPPSRSPRRVGRELLALLATDDD